MQYRRLGKTGLRVSVVGLGTYQFGGRWGKDFTQQEACSILSAAKDCGINLIDTAECYGPDHLSETLVGRSISSARSHWLLATKFGHVKVTPTKNRPAYGADEVRIQVEESLRALQTDTIDLYQFHSGSNEHFDNDELWELLERLQQEGKIQHIGISVSRKEAAWRTYQTQQATQVGAGAIQVKYNLLERDAETEVLPYCIEQDLGVLARVPLASGLLSGKYQNVSSFDPAESRAGKYGPELFEPMQREIDRITANDLPDGMTLPQYALSWCLSHPAVSCVIPGCKSVEHVKLNAAVGDLPTVSDDHLQAVAESL